MEDGMLRKIKGLFMTAAPLTIKPCRECGKPMECTSTRKVCSLCRREKEKMYKREKRKAATASNGKSGNPIRLPLNLLTGNF
jgi:hypothetical protein